MAITEDLPQLERMLNELITRYEQYFIGLEKREPLPMREEVEKLVRRYANTQINNTMLKHKYLMLVARFNTYREHWNRTVRLIEEGKYARSRFIGKLHQQQDDHTPHAHPAVEAQQHESKLDLVYQEFRKACATCHLPVEKINRDSLVATIEKNIPDLSARLEKGDLTLRVVIEEGKPKIKASRHNAAS